jgi:hypothetical protein
MATKAKQPLYFVKTRRGGFPVRVARDLTYKKAATIIASLNRQGFIAIMERQ